MACKYMIPPYINITFDKKEFPELTNRIYRILWTSIAIGHLKDQHFNKNVSRAVRAIKNGNPKSFKDFLNIIHNTSLCCFGRGHYGRRARKDYGWHHYKSIPINKRWWLQVWNLINHNGDIELRQKPIF